MYVTDAINLLLRRWYVLLIGVLLVAVAAVAVMVTVPTTYQATGQLLLLPPSGEQLETDSGNPYLDLPGGVTFTASLVSSTLSTLDAQRDLEEAGFESDYSISVPLQSGPILIVEAKDTDAAAALATRDEILDRVELTLAEIQDSEGTPLSRQIVPRRFNDSGRAEVLAGSKVRAFAMVGAMIIILTLLAAFGIDRRSASRRKSVRIAADDPEAVEAENSGVVDDDGAEAAEAADDDPMIPRGTWSALAEAVDDDRAEGEAEAIDDDDRAEGEAEAVDDDRAEGEAEAIDDDRAEGEAEAVDDDRAEGEAEAIDDDRAEGEAEAIDDDRAEDAPQLITEKPTMLTARPR